MAERERWHLEYLDALRGWAVASVILVHIGSTAYAPGHWQWDFIFWGQRGVQLFFMVSAFTLYLSLDNRKVEHHPTLNFFLRRFFRIAPFFYFMFLLRYVTYYPVPTPALHVVLATLFLNGLYPPAIHAGPLAGWTIGTEFVFYMLLPLLHRWIHTLNRAIAFTCTTAVLFGFGSLLLSRHMPSAGGETLFYLRYSGIPVELGVFGMGIVAYYLVKDHVMPSKFTSSKAARQISFLLLIIAAALFDLNIPFGDRRLYLSSLLFLVFLLAVALHPWPLFVNKLTRTLGRISFSLYLWHVFVIIAMFERRSWFDGVTHGHYSRLLSTPISALLTGIATLLLIAFPLSYLTWRFIEEPGIRLGRRVIAHLEHRTTRRKTRLIPPAQEILRPSHADEQF